jgi:cysteine-rich repeat protein
VHPPIASDRLLVVVVGLGKFLPALFALGVGACVVGVNDVEEPASGGNSGTGASGSGGTAGAGGSTDGGSAGSSGSGGVHSGGGGTSGSGGAAGGGSGGVAQGGSAGSPQGGSGGTSVVPVCGNKVLEAPEECDDGDLDSGDGCSDKCQVECNEQVGEYKLVDNHCYRGLTNQTWSGAEAACVAWNGHLISISSDDEFDMASKISDAIGTPAWIGLTDQAAEGQYVWTDGTPYVFKKWEPGEPNDVVHIENCVVMAGNNAGSAYSWYDEMCLQPFRAICERAVGVP